MDTRQNLLCYSITTIFNFRAFCSATTLFCCITALLPHLPQYSSKRQALYGEVPEST